MVQRPLAAIIPAQRVPWVFWGILSELALVFFEGEVGGELLVFLVFVFGLLL